MDYLPEFDEPMPQDMVDRIWNSLKAEINKRISVLDQVAETEPEPFTANSFNPGAEYVPLALNMDALELSDGFIYWN